MRSTEPADQQTIRSIFGKLLEAYGPQNWWPADSATEVVIGAILTQNTAWTNVERAIENLKQAECLSFEALRNVSETRLAELIKPSGTFRIKAARLKTFVSFLWKHHDGSLEAMLTGDLQAVRTGLLSISGIGPETADAILLYAGNRPTFVVDAYTKRILRRHFMIDSRMEYETVRRIFHDALPPDSQQYNEYHALLVELGKQHCKTKARCDGCPMADFHHDAGL